MKTVAAPPLFQGEFDCTFCNSGIIYVAQSLWATIPKAGCPKISPFGWYCCWGQAKVNKPQNDGG